jgi:hypothetical protein
VFDALGFCDLAGVVFSFSGIHGGVGKLDRVQRQWDMVGCGGM